jgi:hypothetical protein
MPAAKAFTIAFQPITTFSQVIESSPLIRHPLQTVISRTGCRAYRYPYTASSITNTDGCEILRLLTTPDIELE